LTIAAHPGWIPHPTRSPKSDIDVEIAQEVGEQPNTGHALGWRYALTPTHMRRQRLDMVSAEGQRALRDDRLTTPGTGRATGHR
jgi:hypothetical protein